MLIYIFALFKSGATSASVTLIIALSPGSLFLSLVEITEEISFWNSPERRSPLVLFIYLTRLDFLNHIALDNIAYLDILEAFNRTAALEAERDFLYVVLEAFKLLNVALYY